MKTIVYAAIASVAFGGTAFAGAQVVPEIDALSGLAAIAAVGGVGALLWERRRK